MTKAVPAVPSELVHVSVTLAVHGTHVIGSRGDGQGPEQVSRDRQVPSVLRVPPFRVQPAGMPEIETATSLSDAEKPVRPRLIASPEMPAG